MQQLKQHFNKLNKNISKTFQKHFKKLKRKANKWVKKVKKSRPLQLATLCVFIAIVTLLTALYQRHHRIGAEKEVESKIEQIESTEDSLEDVSKDLQKAETDLDKLRQEKYEKIEQIKKLEQELQAKLQRQEATRLAAAVKDTTPTQPATQPATTSPSGTCADWIKAAGVTDVASANELIRRESGCNPTIWNGTGSGACGIPQALPCSKLPQGINTSPVDQIIWMQNYVNARYGGWAQAVAFHDINNWY